MIDMTKFLKDSSTTGFFSFLIGFGVVVLLFHKPFSYHQSLSLPISKIEGKPVRQQGKCYTYRAEDTLCPLINKHE
jgi:hypothetical protein